MQEKSIKRLLEQTNNEAGLDLLLVEAKTNGVNQEILGQIEAKREEVTKNYIKCEVCGKTYGTLRKTDTGYAHQECKKDTFIYIKNALR